MKRLHEFKIDDAKYYEKVWADEFNTRPYYDAVRQRALIKYVKDGDKVIDVGAGVFGSCQFIVESTKLQCSLFAFDQSYTAKEIINRIAPQITYLIGDCSLRLPFEDDTFDCVIAGEIIEHMENPADFAEELMRICKPDGMLSLSTVNPHCENAKNRDYPEHLWEFTPEELVGFFLSFGETRYEVVGDYHFIYCKKYGNNH